MKVLYLILASLLLCSCNSKNNLKQEGDLFCDKAMLGEESILTLDYLNECTAFIKVGRVFTFKNINYVDKLSMPLEIEKVNLVVVFNNDNSITFIDKNKAARKSVTGVDCEHGFFGKMPDVTSVEFEKGGMYKVDFQLDDNSFCTLFQQLPYSDYGRNEFGIEYSSSDFRYFSTPHNYTTLWPFDY